MDTEKKYKLKPIINAYDLFKGLSQYLYNLSNTGKVLACKILNMQEFEDYIIFKVENRGVIMLRKHETSVKRKDELFFTDPREIQSTEKKNLVLEIKEIEKKIEYLNADKETKISYLQRSHLLDDKNDVVIATFMKNLELNTIKFKEQFQKSNS